MKILYKLVVLLGILLTITNIFADNEYALGLDGGKSFYIYDGNDALDITDNWTIETWINVGSYVSSNWECIMDRRTVFSFYLISDDLDAPTGDFAVRFVARSSGGSIIASVRSDSSEVACSFDTWIHLAVSYDGTNAKLFIDDTQVDTNADEHWLLTSSNNTINFGGRYWGSYSRQMSDADIDEIRVSNIARDIGNMQTDVNDDPYSVDSNTILLMHLNDQGNPPTYETGTDPMLNGTSGDDGITIADYVDPGALTFGDQSAPTFADTYPKIQNETATTMDLAVQIDEDGTAYYVVLDNEATEPTVEEVKAGTGSGGSAVVSNGEIALVADIESIENIIGLVQNTEYDIYIVAEDDEVPANLQDVVTKIDASTMIDDITPPVFADTYPKITENTASRLNLAAQIDENGIAYFVVLENEVIEPTVQEVLNGTGNGGNAAVANGNISLSANIEGSILIENLDESTDFDIYIVAEDDAVPANVQASVTLVNANTLYNYRSSDSGSWFSRGIWEIFDGSDWNTSNDSPSSSDNTIFIRSGHTVSLADTVEVDQMTIETNGQLTITEEGKLIIDNGADMDLSVSGIVRKESDGIITRIDDPAIEFLSGSRFELAGTNKFIIEADWDINSTCEITGSFEGSMNYTYHTDQSFGNFIWNCPNQINDVYFSGALTEVNGDFQLIETNGFELRLTGTTGADPVVNIYGNFEISGGILNLTSGENNIFFICYNDFTQSGGEIKATGTGAGNLRFGPMTGIGFSGTFTHTGGVFTPTDVQIRESYSLTLNSNLDLSATNLTINGIIDFSTFAVSGSGEVTVGETGLLVLNNNLNLDQSPLIINGLLDASTFSVSGDSTFTLNSSGILRTGNILGLDGTILMTDIITLSPAADYAFNGTIAQVTGSILPTEISDGLFIINDAGVTLSDSTMISGGNSGLVLNNGRLFTGDDNLLVFDNDGGWSEASDNSFVSGPIAKRRNSTEGFIFPVGKDTIYAPIQIIPETADDTYFQAEYHDHVYMGAGSLEESLESISSVEYWTIDRLSGTANAKARLYWQEHSFETLPDSLVVSRMNGAMWMNEGQFEIDLENQWVTSEIISEFSPFTFGSAITSSQPPAIPANIQIEISGTNITISWEAATGASNYTIYSSDDPYAENWTILESGITNIEHTFSVSESTKFYRVTANN